MGQVNITLLRADTNQEFDVELPDDVEIRRLLPAVLGELALPTMSNDGNIISYGISNKRTGQEYGESDVLSSSSTKEGDTLLLTSTFVAG